MVSALIEATGRCIARHGLDGTSTPAVAKLAGVSVGSLYQYFRSRDELIDALIDQLAIDLTRVLDASIRGGMDRPLDELTAGSIASARELLHSNEGLYLELVRNWHRLPTHKVADVLQKHIHDIVRIYFGKHYLAIPLQDLHVKTFIVVNSTLFTVVRYLAEDQPLITEQEIAQGLNEMISGYLLPKVA